MIYNINDDINGKALILTVKSAKYHLIAHWLTWAIRYTNHLLEFAL